MPQPTAKKKPATKPAKPKTAAASVETLPPPITIDAENYKDAPRRILEILAHPPVLPGESAAAFKGILDWLAQSLAPEDAVEVIWTRSIADQVWEIERNQRLRNDYLKRTVAAKLALSAEQHVNVPRPEDKKIFAKETMESFVSEDDSADQIRAWFLRKNAPYPQFAMSEAYRECLPVLEQFERLIDSATKKRDTLIKQFEQRRRKKDRPKLKVVSAPAATARSRD